MKQNEATAIDHDGTTVRASMHTDETGRAAFTFHTADANGATTTKVFDLAERSAGNAECAAR